MASGPRAPAALRRDLLVLIVELLLRASPEAPATETRTDEGIRIDLSPDAARRTDYIRELILAAQRIVAAPGLPAQLRERAVRRMLAKWAAVSNYIEIWSPGNITDLAEALGAIAVAEDLPAPLCVAILDGLLAAARSIPVIRALGAACAGGGDDPAVGAKRREVAEKFAGLLQNADYAEPEDQEALLEALGRIADLPVLGASPAEGEPVRRRAVECLLAGLHRGSRRAREALLRVVGSPRAPESLRQAIRDQLQVSPGEEERREKSEE
jgi:hypothetical protein